MCSLDVFLSRDACYSQKCLESICFHFGLSSFRTGSLFLYEALTTIDRQQSSESISYKLPSLSALIA